MSSVVDACLDSRSRRSNAMRILEDIGFYSMRVLFIVFLMAPIISCGGKAKKPTKSATRVLFIVTGGTEGIGMSKRSWTALETLMEAKLGWVVELRFNDSKASALGRMNTDDYDALIYVGHNQYTASGKEWLGFFFPTGVDPVTGSLLGDVLIPSELTARTANTTFYFNLGCNPSLGPRAQEMRDKLSKPTPGIPSTLAVVGTGTTDEISAPSFPWANLFLELLVNELDKGLTLKAANDNSTVPQPSIGIVFPNSDTSGADDAKLDGTPSAEAAKE